MREFCLTEEILQQFMDGELSPERTESVAAHLAACDTCANTLGEVEQENEILSQAFAPELGLSIPTIRLRERIDSAIADLTSQPARTLVNEASTSRPGNWWRAFISSLIPTPQRGLAFASLAAVVVFATVFVVIQLRQNKFGPDEIVVKTNEQPKIQPAEQTQEPTKTTGDSGPVTAPTGEQIPEVIKASDNNQPSRKRVVKRSNKFENSVQPAAVPSTTTVPKLLPGERSYLEAIASLTTAIEQGGEQTLKPTVRADYERNLAVVDQAIASTRSEAKRNPNDRYATEFMYTAYQNKIELLSAVAEQTRGGSR